MVTRTSYDNIIFKILVFIFFVILPFGQIPAFIIDQIFNFNFRIHLLDILVIPFVFITLRLARKINSFVLIAMFSSVIAYFSFGYSGLSEFLYLLRLISYMSFGFYLSYLVKVKAKLGVTYYDSLILGSLVVGVVGWVQYVLLPDLRFMKSLGWDDHAYRLVSTLLDPAFAGIVIVLGILLVVIKILEGERKSVWMFTVLFLVLSLAFTYSRSSYLALAGGLLVLGHRYKINKKLFLYVLIFGVSLLLLPRPSSEGVKLERLHSVFAKRQNYEETLGVFYKSPLFGVGFNNICKARRDLYGVEPIGSHSCNGADNSFLFVLATTGVIGAIAFVWFVFRILLATSNDYFGNAFLASISAIVVHSGFTNTLFYMTVMGWIAVLWGISRRSFRESR